MTEIDFHECRKLGAEELVQEPPVKAIKTKINPIPV
jgi:hypothetical protein